MKIIGITIDGVNENNKREAIILDLSEENFNQIYLRGKNLWDKGYTSKYLIDLINQGKCFRYVQLDQYNFENYYHLDDYMKYDDELQLYNSNNKHFLIGDSWKYIIHIYHAEEILHQIPNVERKMNYEL